MKRSQFAETICYSEYFRRELLFQGLYMLVNREIKDNFRILHFKRLDIGNLTKILNLKGREINASDSIFSELLFTFLLLTPPPNISAYKVVHT